jgi:uncharacterized protein (TIGR02266 family)
MPERRTAIRIDVNLPARCASDAAAIAGWVSSLSRSGMFIRSEFLDSAGTEVAVAVTLPGDAQPIELAGEVVRVDEDPLSAGMGIRFTTIPTTVRRRLANFMIERSFQALQ